MRKLKTTEVKNFGTIKLDELEFAEDYLEIFIPVENVSAQVQQKINDAIEINKKERIVSLKEYFAKGNKDFNKEWSKEGINIDYLALKVTVRDKKFTYELFGDFSDKEDDFLWDGFCIDVDLKEYEKELKKIIIHTMIDKFF